MAKAIARQRPATIDLAAEVMHKTVCKIANKAVKRNRQDFADVYQIGMIGLTRAYYDYETDNPRAAFSTVAYKYINQHITDFYQRKAYDYYNTRDFKTATEHLEKETYFDNPLDAIEYEQKLKSLDTVDQIITVARGQGYTFQEIADMLNRNPKHNFTLHQCHNRFKKAIATFE